MRGLIVVYLLGIAAAWCGSQSGVWAGPLPVFTWCAFLAFGLQWLAYVPAYLWQTEKFYDLTGSITYSCCVLLALYFAGTGDEAGNQP